MLEFVLDKTEVAGIWLVDTTTAEESRRKTRENIIDNELISSRFYPIGSTSPKVLTTPTIIECKYEREMYKVSASSWVDQIINRSTFRGDKNFQFICSWLDFLFAQQSSNVDETRTMRPNPNLGMWSWSCKHPKLNGQGIAGFGVMINVQGGKTVEIALTRWF